MQGQAMRNPNEAYQWLFEWREPQELLQLVEAERLRLDADKFLKSRVAKVLREAWVVGKIGSLLEVSSAMMSDNDPPDAFFMLHSGRRVPVEVTELLQGGRRRGHEDFGDIRHQSDAELTAALNHNDDWLEVAVTKKLKKDTTYLPETVILIYHNTALYDWGSAHKKILSEFELAARRKGVNITGSIILFDGKLYGEATIRSLQT